ncbi:winged helix DNA-binding domain-containing protein [Streptomyces albidoflavus]|uniref:winged helix DNA-binding domain-containing protein n=1 Tax=Streptomyces albidoflavus TaxID=1886 RepID=UPI001C47894D|nr:winged helix DNA-binding domain-containing protein [Streptomyces albidoflavus]MBV7649273.1 winged helix DNA-binding domain-containing protein [Streptomyces albidoflavus]MBV7710737.1 winged helix DNA-binding domain-containing protein [Streptomyces albidoflavus]
MPLTPRELNRATLARQLLLERSPLSVPDGVRQVVALQAQHPASPYVALWNRLGGFDPAGLDAAFAGRTVVKATLMRITLHAVHAEDYAPFRAAMQPTLYGARLGARFAETGLTPADAARLLPGLLEFARTPRTSAALRAWVEAEVGAERRDGAWWGLKGYAPLHHAPTEPPWTFGQRPSFIAAGLDALPTRADGDPHVQEALRTLILRYLSGFGPASVADVAQFALVRRTAVRQALAALGEAVVPLTGPDGTPYYDLPDAPRPDGGTPAPPRLLGMWDSILLAYADRARVIPPAYRPLVIRRNGDVLPTLLVDGEVAGVWRPVGDEDGAGDEGGNGAGIEATAFHPLSPTTWDALAAEARSLTALLTARDLTAYRRYGHWWAKLPEGGEVRRL